MAFITQNLNNKLSLETMGCRDLMPQHIMLWSPPSHKLNAGLNITYVYITVAI